MTKVIGIAGRKGSGKDTAAEVLLWQGFENVKFAGALKGMIRAFLSYIGEDAVTTERLVEGDLKEVPQPFFGGKSTRQVMQTLGTEWGRNLVWEDLWTNTFALRCLQFPLVVCTDMRFPNEVSQMKDLGGVTIRIERPDLKQTGHDDHPSETLIDTLSVDRVIINDGNINDLHNKLLEVV